MNSLSLQAASPTLIQRVVKRLPGNTALRHYQRAWLPRDLVAGLVLCALLVPQGMAFAELAGLPAITGLYTTVVCLTAYALFCPSPYLALGPDSSLVPMISAAILPLAAGDVDYSIALAGMLTLMVGLICFGAGITRLGFVSDLLSTLVKDKIECYGLYDTIDQQHFYPTIEVAVDEFHLEWQAKLNQEGID